MSTLTYLIGNETILSRRLVPDGDHYAVYWSGDFFLGISWRCDGPGFAELLQSARRHGGHWNGVYWMFKDNEGEEFLSKSRTRNPDWPVVRIDGAAVDTGSVVQMGRIAALYFTAGAPTADMVFALLESIASHYDGDPQVILQVESTCRRVVIIGNLRNDVNSDDLVLSLGDNWRNDVAPSWLVRNGIAEIKINGWEIELHLNVNDPRHLLFAPRPVRSWHDSGWNGTLRISRCDWPEMEQKLESAGIDWEGDDPHAALCTPLTRIATPPGWDEPTIDGLRLHPFQRDGGDFLLSRAMRGILGDEMGVGKTAEAIAAIEAIALRKILIVVPTSARYVWDSEIRRWGQAGANERIVHLNANDEIRRLDSAGRWVIVTSDLLVARSTDWTIDSADEEEAIRKACAGVVPSPNEAYVQRRLAIEVGAN